MEKWLKIDYELIDIPKDRVDKNIFMPGAKWADPNEKSFKDVVKRFRKKPQKPEEWAKKLQAKVHKKFSFEQIAAAYEEKFGSLL